MHIWRLVGADRRAQTDREAVPAVDGDHRQGERHHLLLVEVAPHLVVEVIGNVGARKEGERLTLGERGALSLRVAWCLSPGDGEMQSL